MTTFDFTLRAGTSMDAEAVSVLFAKEFGYNPDPYMMEHVLEKFPSIVVAKEDGIVGFAYTRGMSNDVLEILRIAVCPKFRSQGLGTRILSELEESARETYSAVVAVSDSRRSAAVSANGHYLWGFYLHNGYNLVAQTPSTRMAWKELDTFASLSKRGAE